MQYWKLITTAALSAALAACGGGNGSDSAAAGPTATSTESVGTVTGFGSVFVNGVEWETGQATFEIDDDAGSESDLKVGHIVRVSGSIAADGSATADHIEYDAELEGPISAIDLGAGTVTVLGTIAAITDDTVFDDDSGVSSIADLSVGDFVEINGYPMSDGSILAVHLERETDEGEVEIVGLIENLDTSASTFDINGQPVDYSGATLDDFEGVTIANDQYVEVEASSTLGPSGELVATKVELEGGDLDDVDEFEIEGIITAVNSNGTIVVAGLTINVGGGVEYENGTSADIEVDVRVEVEGNVNSAGDLVATEIEFKIPSSIEVEATVQDVNTSAGTLTVLGIEFGSMLTTQFEDDSEAAVTFFDLGDISEGDWVSIYAYIDSNGDYIATRVERDDPSDMVALEGPVDSVAGDQLVVMGVTVTTSSETEFDNGGLGAIQPGSIVEVDGVQTGDTAITAFEVEIED